MQPDLAADHLAAELPLDGDAGGMQLAFDFSRFLDDNRGGFDMAFYLAGQFDRAGKEKLAGDARACSQMRAAPGPGGIVLICHSGLPFRVSAHPGDFPLHHTEESTMARAQGARSQMALAFEMTYGTPPASGFTRMPFASTSLGSEQPLLNSELLGHGRDPLAPIKDAVTADGDVVVPLDAEAFGFWLKAAFGAPTTTGVEAPFTHAFQSGSWTLPSLSIETGMPEVPRYAMYSGCVLDQLSWQMQRSGMLTATARLVAQGETLGTTTSAFGEPAAPPAELALKRFGHFNGSITRNGSGLGNVVSAEITYANNLDRIETIRSDGNIDGADPSIAALTGRIEVRFADSTLVSQAINGDPCEIVSAYILPSGESFTLTIHAVYLPRPRIEISGPQGVQATFDWQAARDSTVGRMCTATLINNFEAY